MHDELETAAKELKAKQKAELAKLKKENLEQYAIKGTDADWNDALSGKKSKTLISVKSGEKRAPEEDNTVETPKKQFKKKKRHSMKT